MITDFRVQNYKCLADVELPLTKLHVIIGQNDTGKTSLFEAMQAFSWGINPRKNSSVLEVLKRHSYHQPDDITLYRANGSTAPIKFTASLDDTGKKSVVLDRNVTATGSSFIDIDSYKVNPSLMKHATAVSVAADYRFAEDGFGLATYLDTLQKSSTRKFIALGESLRSYFPAFLDLALEPTPRFVRPPFGIGDSAINAGVEVRIVTEYGRLPLQSLSDGAVLLLAFLSLIYSPKPPDVLLIEEPENGIHPKRLIEVAKLLREFTEREQNAPQIILTTHSPLLLSEFQPEEVTLMRRMPDGSAKAFPLRDAKHIHERMAGGEFYLGELWYNLSEEDLLK